jgi:hypothetical protein
MLRGKTSTLPNESFGADLLHAIASDKPLRFVTIPLRRAVADRRRVRALAQRSP